jgi:WD40 repeat protein
MINCVSFSMDGTYLASGSKFDSNIKIWNVEEGKVIGELNDGY